MFFFFSISSSRFNALALSAFWNKIFISLMNISITSEIIEGIS